MVLTARGRLPDYGWRAQDRAVGDFTARRIECLEAIPSDDFDGVWRIHQRYQNLADGLLTKRAHSGRVKKAR